MTPQDLKEIQKAMGLSTPKFADIMGCSQSLADKMMSGKRTITDSTKIMVMTEIDRKIKSNIAQNETLECLHNRIK